MSNRTVRSLVRNFAMLAGTCTLAFGVTPANAADPLPSVDDIHNLVASGQYREAIVDANRLLTLRTDVAAGIDRGAVLALRGEGDLGLKLRSSAIDSFTAAAKASSDPRQADVAEATEILIEKSPGFHYLTKRKTSPAATQPIDIIATDTRSSAFAALYTDESDAAEAEIARASAATSLAPILATLKTLHRLKMIEEAASGSDTQTLQTSDGLAGHAASLITSALSQMNLQVQAIARQSQASAQSPFGGQGNGGPGMAGPGNGGQGMGGQSQNNRSGLSSDEVSTLQQTVATCQRISTVVTQLNDVSDNTAVAALPARVQSLSDQATQLLDANAQSASAGGQSNSNGNSGSSYSAGGGSGSGGSTGGTNGNTCNSSGGSAGSGQNGPSNGAGNGAHGRPSGRPPAG